jgi:hypothetical protein
MTKTGPTHARHALGEGAWAYRYPATGSRHLQRRRAQLPPAIQALNWKAQGRRCPQERHLLAKGNNAHQGVGAMARAWRACLWAIAKQVAVRPPA